MMKKVVFFALLSCVLLVSCTKASEITQKTYSLSVNTDKAAGSKALYIDDSGALKAFWAEGETVQVIKPSSGDNVGSLTAQNSGKSTTLSGIITGSFKVGNTLRLEFLSASYTSQNGILNEGSDSLDKTCDYATAEVKVLSIEGNTITTEDATFTNRQAIVKFTLKHDSDPFYASEMSVTVTGPGQSITISVVPPVLADELYVAIPCFYDSMFSISVDVLDELQITHYCKNIESQTLENGKYYHYTLNL